MKNLVSRLRDNFAAAREDESGDIVQTLLIIALFVVIVVVIGRLIYNAVNTRGTQVSDCIKNASPLGSGGANCGA